MISKPGYIYIGWVNPSSTTTFAYQIDIPKIEDGALNNIFPHAIVNGDSNFYFVGSVDWVNPYSGAISYSSMVGIALYTGTVNSNLALNITYPSTTTTYSYSFFTT